MSDLKSEGRIKSPCYGCKNRYAGCHAECKEYKQYREEHEAEKALIRKQKEKENAGFRPRMTDKQFQYALRQGENRVLKQHMK